jgi:hypothetical protein
MDKLESGHYQINDTGLILPVLKKENKIFPYSSVKQAKF